MKILYISLSYIPSRRASSMHVMRMCAALSRAGHEVCIVAKKGDETVAESLDVFAFHGVDRTFELVRLGRPRRRGGELVWVHRLRRWLGRHLDRFDLVYARELWGAWIAARGGAPTVFEAHAPPAGALSRALHRALVSRRELARLVAITEALAAEFRRLGLEPRHGDLVVAPDAADPQPWETGAGGARERAPGDRLAVGYVGHLYPGRGVDLLLAAARRRPGMRFHVVGGNDADLEAWRRRQPPANFVLHGFVPPARLPDLYRGFDVLVMPYGRRVGVASRGADTGRWMSPMKLFEYMSTGLPILSSDLPALREILTDGENALLVEPGNVEAWVEALDRLAADPALGAQLGGAARDRFLERHTWDGRARAVLAGLERARAAPGAG